MPPPLENLPVLLRAIAEVARGAPLAEKWLLCPSRRIGQQWLDVVARAGQPCVNFRLHTVASFALAATPVRDGSVVTPLGRVVLAARLLQEVGGGYLGQLRPSLAFAERLAGTLHDLRLAGVTADRLQGATLESDVKRADLARLLAGYARALAERQLVDEADLLRQTPSLPAKIRVLVPADLELAALPRQFLDRVPAAQRMTLPVDEPRAVAFTETFCAVGETNEVREVLRRCLANGWPLDTVEILHTDSATYLPRLFEVTESLEIPTTFAEGVPVAYTRPGRALAAFLAWRRDDFPQTGFVAMVRDGLLCDFPGALAGALRVMPIGFGRDRYLPQLDARIVALGQEAEHAAAGDGESDRDPDRAETLRDRQERLRASRAPLEKLLACARREPLAAAAEFLKDHARSVNDLDNFAREVLFHRLAELQEWFENDRGVAPGRALPREVVGEWLLALVAETRVRGEGPRPGRLHVARWDSGGHSGRAHTFIVGLDAGRFPPASRQDPVLLDGEREGLSAQLPTATARREAAKMEFDRLRARLRGTICGSYARLSLVDDAEQAAGLAMGKEPVAATAPATAAGALSESEWWLWRACRGGAAGTAAATAVGECWPWLKRGLEAARQRASAAFTEFDGFVPGAGDVAAVFSASRLETLGTCPLRFFFRYGLRIKPPEELELDAERWLPPMELGRLLHDVFCRHLRDGVALETALAENIQKWRADFPPPSEGVFRRDRRRLERALQIFAAQPRAGKPIQFEAEIPAQPVGLADGTQLLVRGRIDRVDETPAGLELWDYKSGSASRYRNKDPFIEGRILQHGLYCEIAKQFYGKPVSRFAFFFVSDKGRGETIEFTPKKLEGALTKLAQLRQLVASGAFCATDSRGDCNYCDYQSVCRNVAAVTGASKRKMCEPGNEMLAPFRELRSGNKEE